MNLFEDHQRHPGESKSETQHHSTRDDPRKLSKPDPNDTASKTRLEPLHSHSHSSAMASKPDNRLSLVIRGDSTASSASSRPFESDRSAPSSRRSSQSSVDTELPQLTLKPWNTKPHLVSASQPNFLSTEPCVSPIDFDSPILESPTDWFEKPLPLRPFDMAAELTNMKSTSTGNVANRSSLFNRPLFKQKRASAVIPVKGVDIKDRQQPGSPKSNRGARLGITMTQGMQRRFSTPFSKDVSSYTDLATSNESGTTASKRQTLRQQALSGPVEITINVDNAEPPVLQILYGLDDIDSLKSAILISRVFYTTFKKNESSVVGHVLRSSSLPAWEALKTAQETSAPLSMQLCDRYYQQLKFLKWMISNQCKNVLQPELFSSRRVDNALWRVAAFCQLFGPSKGQVSDMALQLEWMRGEHNPWKSDSIATFGSGNLDGLSSPDLQDMIQIWECLKSLLSGFSGRVREARTWGIFKDCRLDATYSEQWYLDEWISWVVGHGPFVVASLASANFGDAAKLGLLLWTAPRSPDHSRSAFLVNTIDAALQERTVADAVERASKISVPPPRAANRASMQPAPLKLPVVDEGPAKLPTKPSRRHSLPVPSTYQRTQPVPRAKVGTIRRKPVAVTLNPAFDKSSAFSPLSPDTVGQEIRLPLPPTSTEAVHAPLVPEPVQAKIERTQSETSSSHHVSMTPASPTSNPTMYQSLGMTTTASTRLGATLFPISYPPSPSIPQIGPGRRDSRVYRAPTGSFSMPIVVSAPAHHDPAADPEIIDPVDKAMALLTKDMGFKESDAKRALAKCDTGYGMDVQRAIDMLTAERRPHAGLWCSASSAPTPGAAPDQLRLPSSHSTTSTAASSRPSLRVNCSAPPALAGSGSPRRGGSYCYGCGRRQALEAPGSAADDLHLHLHHQPHQHHPQHRQQHGRKVSHSHTISETDLGRGEEDDVVAPLRRAVATPNRECEEGEGEREGEARAMKRSASKVKAYRVLGVDSGGKRRGSGGGGGGGDGRSGSSGGGGAGVMAGRRMSKLIGRGLGTVVRRREGGVGG